MPGDVEGNQLRVRVGHLPWWAAPDLKIHFLRPLTSVAFVADTKLFDDAPLGYHLHSLVWYLALLGVAALLFRRWLPPAAANLALAVFGLAASHVEAYAWISARHVVIAGAFAAAALAALGAGRRWLALGLLVAGLAGSEAALAVVPLWVGLELAAAGPWRSRLRACLPVVALAFAYLVAYAALGAGTRGSDGYHDPMSAPLSFVALAAVRVPLLLGDAALGLPAELAHVIAEWHLALLGLVAVAFVALAYWLTTSPAAAMPGASPGASSGAASGATSGASSGATSGASSASPGAASGASSGGASGASSGGASGASSASPGAASGASPGAASGASPGAASGASSGGASGASSGASSGGASGAALSASSGASSATIPVLSVRAIPWLVLGGVGGTVLGAAGYPAGRVLVIPDLAFAAVIGLVLYRGLGAAWPGRIIAAILAIVHLVIAPLATLRTIAKLEHRARATEAIGSEIVALAPPSGRVFVIAASDPMVFLYPRGIVSDTAPGALRCWSVLSAARAGHRITRTGEHTLVVEPIERPLLAGSFDRLFRDDSRPFALGDQVEQCGATIRVAALRDGHPSRLEVELRRSLDDPELGFLAWRDHRLERFTLPRIGETVELPWSPGPSGAL
ncbi:MAG TPA: hypothetical protein VH165_15915 [Kofleriaceae bacterium]|nr:hypothetical protein [Kofleriaceae bacterium]